MKELMQSGLYGSSLIEIKSSKLISRYNSALKAMGLETTKLTKFHIDKMGWSPEISEEKDNIFYLTHSLANPMAIIITIEQKNCPIYFPYHSFDKYLMEEVFEKFSTQIMDITTQEAIWLDLDNGISRYKSIYDILLIDSIEINMDTPGNIVEHAKKQKSIVSEFIGSDDLWQNADFREKLKESSSKYGDLRFRQLSVSNMTYMDIRLFFTKALGGVYVFRSVSDINDRDTIVICENKEVVPKNNKTKDLCILHVEDKKVISKLIDAGYIEVDLDYYWRNIDELKQKQEVILADYVCTQEDDIDFFDFNSAKKKSYISKYEDELPDVYFELETFIKRLSKYDDVDSLSRDLKKVLLKPAQSLPERFERVIYRLLSAYDETDPVRFYRYRKTDFYDKYKLYTDSQKKWVRQYITENYLKHKDNYENIVIGDEE